MRFLWKEASPGVGRVLLVMGVLMFMAAFHLVYVAWLNPIYGYLGFTYPASAGALTALGYCLGTLPALWMPIALTRPSQFLSWTIYLIVYVPTMLMLSFLQLQPNSQVMWLQVTLLLAMTIIGSGSRIRIRILPRLRVSKGMFWGLLAAASVALMARVVTVYWGHFQFVRWQDTYESLRFTGSDIAEAAGLAYPIYWLSIVFLPIFLSVALLQKRPWLFVLTASGQVLLYMTQGMKHILFSIVYIPLMFLIVRRHEDRFGLRIVWITVALFLAFYLYVMRFDAARDGVALLFGANVVMRVFGIPGLLLGNYQSFFAQNPLTFYSHVGGVNRLIAYPYQHALGLEVGIAMTGNLGDRMANANAGFWATDGLAALGLPGIILISLLIALVFYGLDCVSSRQKASVVALFLSQYAIALTNISFFTSLITGGLVIFFLILYLMPGTFARGAVCYRPAIGRHRLPGTETHY